MNKKACMTAMAIAALLISIIGMQSKETAEAQYRTIIVPDNYPTINQAIGNATEGDTILVRKGVYENPVNQTLAINKTIQLVGEDPDGTHLIFHPPLIPVQIFTQTFWVYDQPIKISSDGTKLSGFSISSDGGDISAVGNGIQIVGNNMSLAVSANGDGIRIINNTLKGISAKGSNQTIVNNIIPDGDNEYILSILGSFNTVEFNSISGSGGGIYLNGSHNIVYENLIAATGAQGGLELNGRENIAAKNNISRLVRIGESFPNSSCNIILGNTITSNLAVTGNNNTFNGNYVQGLSLGNRIADASNNTFSQNNFDFVANGALPQGEKTFTIWIGVQGPVFLDNGSLGNYYNDYNGSDSNSDGIGDTPYVLNATDPLNFHYMAESNVANLTLRDDYPLIEPFDISKIVINLPKWETPLPMFPIENPVLPSPSISPTQEPSTPSSSTSTPIHTMAPTLSPSLSPTLEPTLEPTLTPGSSSEAGRRGDFTLAIFLTVVVVVAVALGVLVYVRRKRAAK